MNNLIYFDSYECNIMYFIILLIVLIKTILKNKNILILNDWKAYKIQKK